MQYVMDRMAAWLALAVETGLFSEAEARCVAQRRTTFEYTLRRRALDQTHVQAYLAYEAGLSELRVMRARRLGAGGDASREAAAALRRVHAGHVRHVCYVFDRAVRRFSDDMSLWAAYLAFLRGSGCAGVLNTVFGRALALHPKCEELWLDAAALESSNSNAHAARVLLQRGIRANGRSARLWERYFELECVYALRISERKELLGLAEDANNQALLLEVPFVVFSHAMQALSDARLGVAMLGAAAEAGLSGLASRMQATLRTAFAQDPLLWRLLALQQLSPLERASGALSAPAQLLLAGSCASLCVELLAQGLEAVPEHRASELWDAVLAVLDQLLAAVLASVARLPLGAVSSDAAPVARALLTLEALVEQGERALGPLPFAGARLGAWRLCRALGLQETMGAPSEVAASLLAHVGEVRPRHHSSLRAAVAQLVRLALLDGHSQQRASVCALLGLLLGRAEALAADAEGCALLDSCVDAWVCLRARDEEAEDGGEAAVARAVGGRTCASEQRVWLGERLLALGWARGGGAAALLSLERVEDVFARRPQLLSGLDLAPLYRRAAGLLSSAQGRAVVRRAAARCGGEEFQALLARLLLEEGDLRGASHARWRAVSQR